MLTVNTYKGKPRIKTKKAIHKYLMALGIQGLLWRSNALILLLIVFVEEGEVLIQRFGSIENLKIIFGYYKIIEFIVRKWPGDGYLCEEFVIIIHHRLPIREFYTHGEGLFF